MFGFTPSHIANGEKLVLKNNDTCAPSVKDVGVVVNDLEIVREDDTYVKCKKCGSTGARIHSEEWSDGLVYRDYACPACGYSEVYS